MKFGIEIGPIEEAKPLPAGCTAALSVVLIFVGSVIFVWMGLLPNIRWARSQSWVELPCTITHSAVRATRPGRKGSTYSVDIRFKYEFSGQTYESERYNFEVGNSSGPQAKADVVQRYPVGSNTLCFVNPSDPSWAVIDRAWSPTYAIGALGLAFLLAGLRVAYVAQRSSRSTRIVRRNEVSRHENAQSAGRSSTASKELNVRMSPSRKFVLALLFAVFWYTFIWFLGWVFLRDEVSLKNAILAMFLIFMAVVGLAIVAGVVHSFLSLWNPRVRLRMDPGILHLGGAVAFKWACRGDASQLESLTIYLQGKERVYSRKGEHVRVETKVFANITVFEATKHCEIRTGRAEFTMPEFTMHSLDLPNNKIEWAIRVEGSVPRWPDVEEEFPVQVLPLPLPDVPIRRAITPA